jgi:hypothetical protein
MKWGDIMEHFIEYTMIALVFLSLLLLILSFFAKDKIKALEEQIDQLTMSFVQETYQLKKKIKSIRRRVIDER